MARRPEAGYCPDHDSDAYFISVSVDFCMPTINSSTNEEKEEDPTWIGWWPLPDPIKE
ncbi:unnamed protein product [Dovyalis caffra]|uniref:Uncharacterized protein n=1 Tax=Dovyalis caffra TaxID=77055 RepID=A0AAV1SDN3_9ROSI|nr:unnamed protein product [Dovyalis caffra]